MFFKRHKFALTILLVLIWLISINSFRINYAQHNFNHGAYHISGGFAASQLRFLRLTETRSDLEIQGQNINQKRLRISNILSVLIRLNAEKNINSQERKSLKKRIINLQNNDRLLEIELRRIDAQREALESKILDIRKLISKNISSSFKSFENDDPLVTSIRLNQIGNQLQDNGDLVGAIDAYNRAISIDPNSAIARVNLEEAERLLRKKLNVQNGIFNDVAWLPPVEEEPRVTILRSIVKIISRKSSGEPKIGTGWVVKRDANFALVVTNCHIISESSFNLCTSEEVKSIEVEFFSEPPPNTDRLRLPAEKILISDPPKNLSDILEDSEENLDDLNFGYLNANFSDLAVLKVNNIPDDIEPLKLADNSLPRGATVTVIGHPVKDPLTDGWWVEDGQAPSGSKRFDQFTVVGVELAEGSSGSPIFNSDNLVVGMIFRIRLSEIIKGSNDDFGIAYTIKFIRDQLNQWGINL